MATLSKRTMGLMAGAAAILVAGAVLAAPGAHGGRGVGAGTFGPMGRALAALDLTDGQKSQLKTLIQDEQPKLDPLVNALVAAKRAEFETVHAPKFDEAAIRSAAAVTAKARADLIVERARVFAKVKEILTPEQAAKLDTMRRAFADRAEKRARLGRTIFREHASDFIDAL